MLWRDIVRIREKAPLVLNITNYVVMNTSANAILAIGASPVMSNAIEELEEMVSLSDSLVINIGTLSAPWVDAMLKAGIAARNRGVPIVLDPVGSGASAYRTDTAKKLINALHPAVIRGNASEIASLVRPEKTTRGVDSQNTPDEVLEYALSLSQSAGCTVSVSGPVDLIVEGSKVARVANGHPIMTKVTGMGCTSSALTGAFVAINPSPFEAALNAMSLMGVAGEIAAGNAAGPGSFQVNFLDALYGMTENRLKQYLKAQNL